MGLLNNLCDIFYDTFKSIPKPINREQLEKEAGLFTARMYCRGLPPGGYLTPSECSKLIDEAIAATDRNNW